MIRIVLDTNVLLSALLNPKGAPAQVLLLTILEPDIQLCVSGEIFAEYEEVLRRPKFSRGRSEIDGALRSIRENGFWVKPSEKVRACSDPDDDIFLECAQSASAHYLVTGNANHFPGTWASTRVVTPRQFLDRLG
jgi:putative PIN family toxin of toxin-antitoxin system